MDIYTKTGDRGTTSLKKIKNVSKSDERIQLLGAIDELTSHLGLVKSRQTEAAQISRLEQIQKNLMLIMAGIADDANPDYHLPEQELALLEQEIDRTERLFDRKKEFVLPGKTESSAQIDVARTVARRAERWMAAVDKRYTVNPMSVKYLNRLSDYLYVLARYTETLEDKTMPSSVNEDIIVQEVLKQLKGTSNMPVNLEQAKALIGQIEAESRHRGMNSVIAVCTPQGNPVAVHVMDDAYLASFDIAIKKAYTAVAVKMPTIDLNELAKPGQTFYGLDKADDGRLCIIGGGIPLYRGEKIVAGLGVSGGTGEEDHALALYAKQLFEA